MTAVLGGRRRFSRPARMWPLVTSAPPTAAPVSETVSIVSTSLTVLAVVVAWFLAQLMLLGGIEQGRAQDRLYDQFREQLAAATAPVGGIIAPGAPVAVMSIPSLGWEQVVTEGTSAGTLLNGPGHRRDTVLPGQAGVSLVYGRSSTFGRPFAPILSSGAGAKMTVVTGQGTATYTLGSVRRAGDPMPPAPSGTASRITLVTSDGSSALSPGDVVYIDATSTGDTFVAPPGRLNAIAPSETAMAADRSVMPALALSLGALALVTVGVLVARRRFGMARTWLVGAPIVVALAWMSADLTTYLLPNLL
ncbi:sortase domain-bontaining protein [Aeromicrobium endophyticum]|nr:sortase [Aeromicrobium endophyticum]